jgi:hypothetical protein
MEINFLCTGRYEKNAPAWECFSSTTCRIPAWERKAESCNPPGPAPTTQMGNDVDPSPSLLAAADDEDVTVVVMKTRHAAVRRRRIIIVN